ncbi:hypothetical protein BN903_299 [Halorubrum sp. AJ67]|nr:hypothetical protein BN903_299 [Halorubrum sp. AJ67]
MTLDRACQSGSSVRPRYLKWAISPVYRLSNSEEFKQL